MRRLLALLALCTLLGGAPALGAAQPPSVLGLEAQLVCVTCHEPIDMSTSPLAEQMKRFIREKVAAGWTGNEIKAYFVRVLGPQVLAVPPTHGFNLLAWVIPFTLGGIGLVAVGGGAWAWSRNRDDSRTPSAPGGPPLAPGLELRVDQELARYDL
jgi:cytochrome c-type biogenesis protein CcmH